ncbi:MAG: class D sortase [Pseudomonadota bacterium]
MGQPVRKLTRFLGAAVPWVLAATGALFLGGQYFLDLSAGRASDAAVDAFVAEAAVARPDALSALDELPSGEPATPTESADPAPTPATALLFLPGSDEPIPVLAGTSDRALDAGAGHIENTGAPGVAGNFGLAAHRDTYFRPLRHIERGHALRVVGRQGREFTYEVTETFVVEPTEVSVLAPTSEATITLVTCYPFNFIGSAPQRFIVKGVLVAEDGALSESLRDEPTDDGVGLLSRHTSEVQGEKS